ncbi:MAG: plasmid pRiA4b ORF-3 family protein [Deltaproteobacteria bacterium]|jgi:hypothetical protein|nr:plasmid pRiA4b ORF-3 family protein [Deltaproteobacteria bacterium]
MPDEAEKDRSEPVPFYSFRIELKYTKPKIWRYFYVPSNISLNRFHVVIQKVMGWANNNMFSFRISRFVSFESDFVSYYRTARESRTLLEKVKLDWLGLSKGFRFTYRYDMADRWDHILKVLDTDYVPKIPGQKYGCFDGALACPPEGHGGVSAYYFTLDVLKDPTHNLHEEMKAFTDDKFDPEAFDIESINRSQRRMR